MVSWFVNIDPKKKGDPHWMAYADADAEKLERNQKRASVMLNDTYKIDFKQMRQVRRDDETRWRAIKRGGAATDKPPHVDGETDEEEEEAAAPTEEEKVAAPKKGKAAAAAAAVPAAAKGKAAKAEDIATDPAWAAPATPSPFAQDAGGAAAAAASSSKPAAAAAAVAAAPAAAAAGPSLAEAKLRSDLDSLRQQLADVEVEQDAALALHQKELDALKKTHAAELAKAQALAETKAKAAAEAKATQATMAAELKAEHKAAAATAAQAEAASATREALAAKASAAKAQSALKELQASSAGSVSEAARWKDLYAKLITAIKPAAEMFGMAPTTVIGKAIIAWEQQQQQGGAAAAAPPAAGGKKRGRGNTADDETDSVAAAAASPSEAAEESPAPAAKKARAASPVAAAAAAGKHSAAAAAAAVVNEDEDATQPMVAPAGDDEDDAMVDADDPNDLGALPPAAAAAAAASPKPALKAAVKAMAPAAPFLGSPAALEGLLLKNDGAAVVSVAALRATGISNQQQLGLLGCLDGGLSLWKFDDSAAGGAMASAAAASTKLPLDVEAIRFASHAFGKTGAACLGADGAEDYSKSRHVLALLALPLLSDPSGNSFVVLASEGRLLRTYLLTLEAAHHKGALKLLSSTSAPALDAGEGSWGTVLVRLSDPAAAAGSKVAYVGWGVSGAKHSVKVLRVPIGGAAGAAKPALVRSLATRSDEVRAIAQLGGAGGTLVSAGCSVALPGGELKEGGSIELWDDAFDGDAGDDPASRLLANDLRVDPSIGVRCNSLRVLPAASAGQAQQLLACFEYCSNGHRSLVSYAFDGAGKQDKSCASVEPKHEPPADEVTFVDLAVSSRGNSNRAAAITYGGKLLIFDTSAGATGKKALLARHAAHGDSPHEDCTHVFVLEAAEAHHPILLTSGGAQQLKLWRAKQ